MPTGTKWATVNIGATSETDYGNYYMYGKGTIIYNSSDLSYKGDEDPLATSADTAAQVWGGQWHMPTRVQLNELTANTTYTWETNFKGSGINGGKFTAQNGNYVFLPAAGLWYVGSQSEVGSSGYYWSSTPDGSGYAFSFSLWNSSMFMNSASGASGYSVRGVVG